ncbi:MAG: RIP metalloprotease RseP [Candidatus Moranbacteria bacterium]|nr:RIP metalloprotease RseP [Candidatus Moranbacteria bacterium]
MLLAILVVLLILGFLVFVHELGHFLVAKLFGVKAEEFGFGFPPRIVGWVYNEKKKSWEMIKGAKQVKRKNTIYSLNLIPLGGFVKILGEDGEDKEQVAKKTKKRVKNSENFSHKPVWQRILILVAGVFMNFYIAGVIFSLGFFIGTPEPVMENTGFNYKDVKIQILEVVADSPAKEMGLKPGDEILKLSIDGQAVDIEETDQVHNFISQNQGREILVEVIRGDDIYRLKGTPRTEYKENEGSLGIGFDKIGIVSYPLHKAIFMGFGSMFTVTYRMIEVFGQMFMELFQGKADKIKEVSGPIGIVVFTNQFTEMGLAYLIRFAAILSINLAIINILPIPALDGGRILFLIFEKIKGRPVSPKFELGLHTIGMYLLLLLMLFVTVRDFSKFKNSFLVLWEKFLNIF